MFEDRNGTMIYYIYNGDKLLGFKYNGNTYYYHKNIFNEIVCILDSNYNEIVVYEYDSWGCITNIVDNSTINLGIINPFRYRTYYYDAETKLHYLNSRYYDSIMKRFINEDDILDNSNAIFSKNLYSYCTNNPINKSDSLGHWEFWNIIDVISFVDSAKNMAEEPSWGNAGWLALDAVCLLPLIPSAGTVGKVAKNAPDVAKGTKNTVKVVTKETAEKVVKETTQAGWKLGDDITALTKYGTEPSWPTVKKRYWKNEALNNASKYNSSDLLRMQQGKPPLILDASTNKRYSMELHHIEGRKINNPHNFNNLKPLSPWDHAKEDPFRHFKP